MGITTTPSIREILRLDDARLGQAPAWPTFIVCLVCGGGTGYYSSTEGTVSDKALTQQLRLIQFGYYVALWRDIDCLNRYDVPFACTCACDHRWEDVHPRRGKQFACHHASECRRCGAYREYDSGD